jgi:hypothetical protein
MLRVLRAFAWMRWRIFVNSLEKSGARDAVERFSLAIEHIAPILLTIVMVPSAIALAVLAGYAGYQLAIGQDGSIPAQVLRYLLLLATVLSIVGPMILPVADRTNPVRLLLLPITRRTLYVAQAAGALTDPWILLLIPAVMAVPVGMLIGGAPAAMLAALASGILVLLAIIAISALTTTLIHLLLRDRRRGELIALAFVLILPLVSFLPATLGSRERRERRAERGRSAPQERPAPERRAPVPQWVLTAATRAFSLSPSELYTSSIRSAARSDASGTAVSTGVLAALVAALHSIGLLLFGRVLASPLATGARRTASDSEVWRRVLPGLSSGASAVALAQVRLALRTPRGRAILFSPLLMLVFFGLLVMRAGDLPVGPARLNSGFGLATFASSVTLLSILPIAMNQFAVDGAGLTLALLSPLSTRQLLAGKAVGNGLVAIPTALLCVALAAVVFPGGAFSTWLNLVLSLIATYVLASPAAAVFSAIFPRVVDMNSIGRGSNAHGLSGLLGLAAFAVSAAPCIGLWVVVGSVLGQPLATPALLLLWCGVSFLLARVLFRPAARVFDGRRENLAMLM